MRHRTIILIFISLIVTFSLVMGNRACAETPSKKNPLVINEEKREVLIAGYVQAGKFNEKPLIPFGRVRNYHAIVWEGGKTNKSDVLFVSYADDLSIYNAFIKLGAVPGNNLTLNAWDRRSDPEHSAPRTSVKGPVVEVSVTWKGASKSYPLSELINDPGGRGLLFRFGGNKKFIPVWKSGCIICLYSCPGSKIGNAAYTVRDYETGATRFTAREGILPPDGTEVVISLSVRE